MSATPTSYPLWQAQRAPRHSLLRKGHNMCFVHWTAMPQEARREEATGDPPAVSAAACDRHTRPRNKRAVRRAWCTGWEAPCAAGACTVTVTAPSRRVPLGRRRQCSGGLFGLWRLRWSGWWPTAATWHLRCDGALPNYNRLPEFKGIRLSRTCLTCGRGGRGMPQRGLSRHAMPRRPWGRRQPLRDKDSDLETTTDDIPTHSCEGSIVLPACSGLSIVLRLWRGSRT